MLRPSELSRTNAELYPVTSTTHQSIRLACARPHRDGCRWAELTERARLGGRFSSDPPTLGWILAHLLQEYARHVGHLDVVRELMDGSVGE
jgi:hypothetical protein